jgi:hypothetical protein
VTNPDFRDLLAAFLTHSVRFLVVGGYAVAFHARPRFTKDLDVWVEPSSDNAHRVFAALRDFGAPLTGVVPEDFTRPDIVYQVGIAPNRVDVLTSITGVDFAEAWGRRVAARYDRLAIAYLGKSDLIANKRASGRPQDLIDADVLEGRDKG